MDVDRLITDYIRSEELNPRMYNHIIHRGKHFRYFKDFLGDREPHEIRGKEALEYQGFVISRGDGKNNDLSASTVNGYMVAVSNFYDYLKSRNLVFNNPFSSMKRLRVNKKIPRNILSAEDLTKLLNHFKNWNQETNLKRRVSLYRMHVISELLFSTGLRVHEAANLQVDDINLFSGLVTVREGKGGFSRQAILNDYAKEVLYLYINRIRELTFTKRNEPNSHLLFGMKASYFEKYVNESLLKATTYLGINRITSHGFRHAVGYHLLKSGCDIRHIQEILGHKSLTSTEIYTKVDREDLRKVMEKYHPRQMRREHCEADDKQVQKAL